MIDALIKLGLFLAGGLGFGTLVFFYVISSPDKAERIAGWVTTGIARVWRKADKTAVAMKVQGEINGMSVVLHKDGPAVIDKKLKISWTDAEEAEAIVRGGDVVVFMRDSRRHEENIANALMAFLPKALLTRARRYVEVDTMRAVDLIVAKALLAHDDSTQGALEAFYDRHLDPARLGSERLKEKIAQLDMVDLNGWLGRILLAEFRRVGEQLHPAEPDPDVLAEAEEFADWLFKLADRQHGQVSNLLFNGRYFKVAVIFVAHRHVLAEHGTDPYRRRAKRHLYADKFDVVYLMARDPNLYAVDEIVESLNTDAMVAGNSRYAYPLRPDFVARKRLRRTHAICVCLRRRQQGVDDIEELASQENATDLLTTETHTPSTVQHAGQDSGADDEVIGAET